MEVRKLVGDLEVERQEELLARLDLALEAVGVARVRGGLELGAELLDGRVAPLHEGEEVRFPHLHVDDAGRLEDPTPRVFVGVHLHLL